MPQQHIDNKATYNTPYWMIEVSVEYARLCFLTDARIWKIRMKRNVHSGTRTDVELRLHRT